MDTELKCPHCGSTNVKSEHDDGYLVIDTVEPIYYKDYSCRACGGAFTVKGDDETPVLAIIKEYRVGGYYPDGMGLDEQTDAY